MTPRMDVIQRLTGEIAASRRDNPDLRLVIGHGSGSFGHVAAHKYATYQGSHTQNSGWVCEVWHAARMLTKSC